ncbi:Lecithin-cholesterol acyltransferase-like 1 [Forsythia ovata]|uniref:Lecithin-cholesterol acyltransferase-like 1 n=1 Tax=Forsythia ovata TaxID=205694 RepID=A0ABD1UWR5_9LAMI
MHLVLRLESLTLAPHKALRFLDPHLKHITSYMEPIVKSLEEIGYVDGINLFGAPYDFRYGLAAEGHPSNVASKFLAQLKNLIETASNSNEGKPIILLSHSLGGLFVLQLLVRNPISWRQKYIKHFIALVDPMGWHGRRTVDICFWECTRSTLSQSIACKGRTKKLLK